MTLKDLLVKIGFDVEKEKLDGVEKQLEGIKSLMESFAAYEVVKGLVEMTEKFGEMAEKLHLAAISAGITTEAYQKLAYAAQQNGVSQDELSGAMARISRQLYDARMGSAEAQEIFSKAGFSPGQVQGFKNGSDVIHALSDQFKNMKDPIKEMGILLPLAGRGSRDMVAFMEQGSKGIAALEMQAEQFGAVLSGPQVEALVAAEHAFSALYSVVKTLGATIAADFAPSLESAVKEFLNFYAVNKDILQLEIKKWVWDITYALGAVWAIVKFVTQGFLDFAKSHELLVRRVGELLLLLGGLATTLFVVGKAFGALKIVFGPTIDLFKGFGIALRFVKLAASEALFFISWLTKSEWALSAATAVAEAPLWAIAAAIGAIILVGQALWKLFHGGSIKDTWLGELVEYVTSLKWVAQALSFVKGLFGGGGEQGAATAQGGGAGIGGIAASAASWLGSKGGQALELMKAVVPTPYPGAATAAAAAGGETNTEINAPITINVPAGTNPQQVGESVKQGVKEHLDRVHREAQRSLRPAQAY